MRTWKNGFTLVELLVVIGIISVLISLLLPSLSKARQAALAATCMSNMRQCYQGIALYAADNKDWFFASGSPRSAAGKAANGSWWMLLTSTWPAPAASGAAGTAIPALTEVWPTARFPYLGKLDVLVCPSWYPNNFVTQSYTANLPDGSSNKTTAASNPNEVYGMNSAGGHLWLSMNAGGNPTSSPYGAQVAVGTGAMWFYRLNRSPDPSIVKTGTAGQAGLDLLLADTIKSPFKNNGNYSSGFGSQIDFAQPLTPAPVGGNAGNSSGIHARHNKLANILYWDGHVEALSRSEIQAQFGFLSVFVGEECQYNASDFN